MSGWAETMGVRSRGRARDVIAGGQSALVERLAAHQPVWDLIAAQAHVRAADIAS
jgi:hypothetical protein